MAERMLNAALKEILLLKDLEKQRLAVKTLYKLANNVYTKPTETKYHKIRPDNPQIKSRIFDIKGGRTALRGIGFGLSSAVNFTSIEARRWKNKLRNIGKCFKFNHS